MELHRGRMIDHLHLVVGDLGASRDFYRAVLSVLGIALGGEGETHFWADELFVSTADSRHAQGQRTGRVHLAFQAPNREAVDEFYRVGLAQRRPVERCARAAAVPSGLLRGVPARPRREQRRGRLPRPPRSLGRVGRHPVLARHQMRQAFSRTIG